MKNFKLRKHTEADRQITNFAWYTDTDNNARITWTWPRNDNVKYMLAASTTDNPPDPLKWLMQDPAQHTVVTRNLAAHYEIPIGSVPRRFIFAPAYLHGKDIAVYGPALCTDLLYAKIHAAVRITNTPLPFSPFKRVKFALSYSDANGANLAAKALRYTLHEFNRLVGMFPLDDSLHAGGYLHIRKTHTLRFTVEPEYAHLIALL